MQNFRHRAKGSTSSCAVPFPRLRRWNGCEIYSKARFFTVTGNHVEGTPLTVAEMTADALEELRSDIEDQSLRPYKLEATGAKAEKRQQGQKAGENLGHTSHDEEGARGEAREATGRRL